MVSDEVIYPAWVLVGSEIATAGFLMRSQVNETDYQGQENLISGLFIKGDKKKRTLFPQLEKKGWNGERVERRLLKKRLILVNLFFFGCRKSLGKVV